MTTFPAFVRAAVTTPGLLEEYDRLRGTSFVTRRTGIAAVIDQATGKTDDDLRELVEFLFDLWLRSPM